jgi:hypothetical protein
VPTGATVRAVIPLQVVVAVAVAAAVTVAAAAVAAAAILPMEMNHCGARQQHVEAARAHILHVQGTNHNSMSYIYICFKFEVIFIFL